MPYQHLTVEERSMIAPRRTLTVDNGSEWATFRCLQRTLGLQVYFASPYAAWERGTNENTNGLLRDYFPKRTDFSMITAQQLASVVEELNKRPRRCLAYRTPAEVFARAADVALRI
jgi:transposase, IS30 family